MASITNIEPTDLITDSRADINNNFENLNNDKIETSTLDTDNTLAADSDDRIATQKAVKAYVDAGGNVNATETRKGIVEIATQAEVDAGTDIGGTGASLVLTPETFKASPGGSTKTMKAGETINGATLPVAVYQDKTDGEFYTCDSNDTNKLKFLGFATSDGTDGSDIEVQFLGVVAGFSALNEGEKYYVQDDGTIGTSIGTYEVLAGVAISTTQLVIQKGKRRSAGTYDLSAVTSSGSEVITCGFRPSMINLRAMSQEDADLRGLLNLSWSNGTAQAINWKLGGSSSSLIGVNAQLHDGSNNYLTFSITSVTDTGFTISWTETNTFNVDSAAYVWSAEGEL